MKKFFYVDNEEQKGPVSLEELRNIGINRSTYVWFEGLDDWVQASQIDELKSILELIPPEIPQEHSLSQTPPPFKSESKDSNKKRSSEKGGNAQRKRTRQSMFSSPLSFSGRIRRTEFGLTVLFSAIILAIVNAMYQTEDPTIVLIGAILSLLVVGFVMAQGAKRCHDFNWSGWSTLLQFLPLVSIIFIFIPGTNGPNQYGNSPK